MKVSKEDIERLEKLALTDEQREKLVQYLESGKDWKNEIRIALGLNHISEYQLYNIRGKIRKSAEVCPTCGDDDFFIGGYDATRESQPIMYSELSGLPDDTTYEHVSFRFRVCLSCHTARLK